MARDLVAEAHRQGVPESHYVRDVLARALGRKDARDEMAELQEAVVGLTRELVSARRDLRSLLQRLPFRR